MPRYASIGKRDRNEGDIVKALKVAGCEVEYGTDVDLYVKRGETAKMMEIKYPGRELELTPLQKKLAAMFGKAYVVVSSPEGALGAMGLV
jgi:hypothetical protein